MSDIVHESLKKMAVGTSIVLAGTIVSMFFEFLSRILIIRSTSTAEYGIFALALVILNIAVIIVTLGLQDGATRQIAYHRGRGDLEITDVNNEYIRRGERGYSVLDGCLPRCGDVWEFAPGWGYG